MKKKSNSSKCSVGLEDLGLVLKVGNIFPSQHEAGDILHPTGIAPTLRPMGPRGSCKVQAPKILDVSGPTTTTNTLAKSIKKNSETKSLSRGTLKIFPPQIYPTITSSQLASLVRVFPLRENVEVFKTSQGELFSGKSAESYEIKDHTTYSLRMLKDYFLTTRVEPSQLYSFHWMNLGMMRNGLSQTLNITYRRTVKGSLFSVLEEKVDKKYYLTEKSWAKFLRRDMGKITNGKDSISGCLSETNQSGRAGWHGGTTLIAPTIRAEHHNTADVHFILRDGRDNRSCLRKGRTTELGIQGKSIRRLTPKECERLQGFPDDWTKGVSDTQRYKQMGNAVSVPVIEAIGKKILGII